MTEANSTNAAKGCLFGLAIGDALAAPTEFLTIVDILRRFPPDGPQAPIGAPARVTDDTQMALAVGEGRWDEDGEKRIPVDVKVGDTVVYSKYGGTEITVEGEDLLILNARDVLAVVKK